MAKVHLSSDLTFETVLERLESVGHPAVYGCRNGFCGDCRLELISGDIEYIGAPLGYCGDDQFLPCIAMAATDIEVIVPVSRDE